MPFGSQGRFLICELMPVDWTILKRTLILSFPLSMGSRTCSFIGPFWQTSSIPQEEVWKEPTQ